MTDFVNRVLNLVILFTALVIAPLLFTFLSSQLTDQRLILNEVTEFLDKTSDKAAMNEYDIDKLYMKLNSHGMLLDVEVERLIYAPTTNADGVLIENYIKADTITDIIRQNEQKAVNAGKNKKDREVAEIRFNSNDSIRVRVREIGTSTSRRVLYTILKIDTGPYELTMSATVQ